MYKLITCEARAGSIVYKLITCEARAGSRSIVYKHRSMVQGMGEHRQAVIVRPALTQVQVNTGTGNTFSNVSSTAQKEVQVS